MKQLLLMIAVVALVGCGTTGATISHKVSLNNANMAKLNVGMTKAQVVETMGPALRKGY